MDKLKQIESRYNASLEVSEEDFDWLVEQVKKVRELERERDMWKSNRDYVYSELKEAEKIIKGFK